VTGNEKGGGQAPTRPDSSRVRRRGQRPEIRPRASDIDPYADLLTADAAYSDLLEEDTADRPPLLKRYGTAIKQMVTHPKETAEAIADAVVMAPVRFFTAPVEGGRVAEGDYTLGKVGALPGGLRPGQAITRDTPGAISREQLGRDAVGTVANAAFPLASRVVGPLAAAAGFGAVQSPDDPALGALMGATLDRTIRGAGKATGATSRAIAARTTDVSEGFVRAFDDVAREAKGPAPGRAAPAMAPARRPAGAGKVPRLALGKDIARAEATYADLYRELTDALREEAPRVVGADLPPEAPRVPKPPADRAYETYSLEGVEGPSPAAVSEAPAVPKSGVRRISRDEGAARLAALEARRNPPTPTEGPSSPWRPPVESPQSQPVSVFGVSPEDAPRYSSRVSDIAEYTKKVGRRPAPESVSGPAQLPPGQVRTARQFVGDREVEYPHIAGDEVVNDRVGPAHRWYAATREWARTHLHPRRVLNRETGWEIGFSTTGLKESLQPRASVEKLQAVYALPELIEGARFLGSEANRDAAKARSVPAYLRFENYLRIGERDYHVEIVARETSAGRLHYDHQLTKFEPVGSGEGGTGRMTTPGVAPAEPTGSTANIRAEPPAGNAPPVIGEPVSFGGTEPPGADLRPKRAGREVPLFSEARTEGGKLRNPESVSDEGLFRELDELQEKVADATRRAQYRSAFDDDQSVTVQVSTGKGKVSSQAKALQNLEDYKRIQERIDAVLKSRGHSDDSIADGVIHANRLKESLERDAMRAADELADADDSFFGFGEEEPAAPEASISKFGDAGQDAAPSGATPEPRPPMEPAADVTTNWKAYLGEQSPIARSVAARVEARVDELKAQRGYQSFDAQRALRDEFRRKLVANPLEIDQAKLQRLDGYQVAALHDIVRENTAAMEAASRALNSGELSGDDLTRAQRVIDEASRQTDEALSAIVRERAQAGRSLGYYRDLAHRSLDPDLWIVQAKKLAGDRPLPDAVMLEIRRLAREAAETCGGGG